MKTYIALLKGINVGGYKKVPMAALRDLLTNAGFQNVQTYIQSGNVIFQSSENEIFKIESKIEKTITDYFEFDVSVLLKTPQDLKRIFEASPFSEEKKIASYFMMLHNTPNNESVKNTSEKVYEGEEYYIINECIYYYCKNGLGRAKFNVTFFEGKLNTFATARNYNTMVKLLSLCAEN